MPGLAVWSRTASASPGRSQPSTPSAPVIPGPPGTPTNITATAGSTSATVSWTPPANVGGGISGYTVTSLPGGKTCTTTGTTCTVTGLTAGSAYSFSVVATGAPRHR